MHVNNTRYLAWSTDAYYSRVSHESTINEITINYASEVHPNEEVYLYCVEKEGKMQVDGFEEKTGRHVFSTLIN